MIFEPAAPLIVAAPPARATKMPQCAATIAALVDAPPQWGTNESACDQFSSERWQIVTHLRSELVCDALEMANGLRRPEEGLISHSDRGSQYTSLRYTDRLDELSIAPSVGSRGDAYDNAMIEAFWSRMQVELLNSRRWKTRVELANAIFEYIEIFHNRRRRHSSLGMLTPIEYELLNNTTTSVA